MFSPNRLLTPKEQALLLGVAVAVLVGSGAIYWSSRGGVPAAMATVTAETPKPGAAKPSPPPAEAKQSAGPAQTAPPPAAMPASPTPPTTAAPLPAAPTPAPVPPAEIAVAVRGGVQRQGLFRLPPDSRVADLIMKAGGATAEADLSEINLAARLLDGTTLTVPVGARLTEREGRRISGRGGQHHAVANPAAYLAGTATPEATGPTPGQRFTDAKQTESAAPDTTAPAVKSKGKAAAGGGLINLNTATQAELESLPGIGPVLAGRIVEQRQTRPFASVDELDNISGIGAKKLDAVRNLVTVE